MKDPTYFERVPVATVREVRIQRLRPHTMLVLAAIMVVAGTVTTFLMARPLLKGEGGKVSGYPPAVVVVGLVIPFVTRGRYGLVVTYGEKRFRWKPDDFGRQEILCGDGRFLDAYSGSVSHGEM